MAGKVMETVIQISGVMSDSVRQSVSQVNKQLGLIDKKALATAAKFAAVASAAAATAGGMAAAFIKGGNDYIRAMNGISAQTGVTGDELKEFGDIARDVYKSGKGENFQEVADALVNIRQASGLAGDELKAATNAAMLLNDTFGMETAETTRAATALMKNFGISAEEAYGIIAVGAQNGANKNDDLLDTFNEYSVHYKALGLNADQFVTSLIKGAEAGSFSIDKVGDAVKEFTIRSKDGSKTSAEGFAAIGLEAETMTAAFAAGGDAAQAAFFQTIKALNAMEDPVAKNAAGVALFGTQWEDLEAGVLDTLASMSDASVDATAALQQMEKVKYNDIGYAITQISRSFTDALIPGMEQAGQAVYQHMPEIQANIEKITPAITSLGETFAAALPGIIDGIAGAANEAAYFASLIVDNWGTIGPVVYGVAGAFATFKFVGFIQSAIAATTAIKATTAALKAKSMAAIADRAATIYLQALYAKDAVMRGLSTAATWAQTAATYAHAAAQRAATIATGAWNAICAVATATTTALGGAIAFLTSPTTISTAATWAHTAATTAWNVIGTIATATTTALGAAFAFLTSPIGLAILAITAIIAAGVLLYQNWETVKAYAGQLGAFIGGIWTSISYGCAAMASAVTGTFSAAFSSIPGLLAAPVNSAISLINSAINAINSIGVTIPDWVPGVGGQSFSVNIPNVPMLAKGGFTNGLSLAGEAGQEAVISFDPAHRQANIGYLQEAAERLGVGDDMTVSHYTDRLANLGAKNLIADSKGTTGTTSDNMGDVMTDAAQLGAYIDGIWAHISAGCTAMANAVTSTFSAAFSSIPSMLQDPVNDAISVINSATNAINNVSGTAPDLAQGANGQANIGYLQEAAARLGLSVTIPDWVPVVGGKTISANIPPIPTLPTFAKGGFTNGVSIAGEAGQEAVISFDPAHRQANIGYLQEAAARLGVDDDMTVNYYTNRLAELGTDSIAQGGTNITYNLGGLVFSPTVTVAGGDTSKESIIDQLRNYHGELLELIEELLQEKEAGSYGTGGVF